MWVFFSIALSHIMVIDVMLIKDSLLCRNHFSEVFQTLLEALFISVGVVIVPSIVKPKEISLC